MIFNAFCSYYVLISLSMRYVPFLLMNNTRETKPTWSIHGPLWPSMGFHNPRMISWPHGLMMMPDEAIEDHAWAMFVFSLYILNKLNGSRILINVFVFSTVLIKNIVVKMLCVSSNPSIEAILCIRKMFACILS